MPISPIGFPNSFVGPDDLFSGIVVKYKKPPVVETVLSVQFNPLLNFGAGQLGVFWKELGSNWPHVTDAPAVDPEFERFEPGKAWEPVALGFKLSQKMNVRLQIRNTAKDRMIQIQNGRFFYNWLDTPVIDYPSYDAVRPEFDEQWEKFRAFLLSQPDSSVIKPNQWEVIYVNHLPQGTVWNELSDLPSVFKFLRQPELDGLDLRTDGIGGEWRFEIGPKKGRLFVRLGRKIKSQEEDTPCIVLTLIARGPIGEEASTLHEGLELGHRSITNAFDKLTSEYAHQIWEVENAPT